MKKLAELLIVTLFIALFAIPVFAAVNETLEFPAGSWEYNAIEQLAAKGYFKDYPDGLAGMKITRDEAAYMLMHALPVDLAQVSGEDADMLEMLVEELRTELSVLGVGVTALDNVVVFQP